MYVLSKQWIQVMNVVDNMDAVILKTVGISHIKVSVDRRITA